MAIRARALDDFLVESFFREKEESVAEAIADACKFRFLCTSLYLQCIPGASYPLEDAAHERLRLTFMSVLLWERTP